MSKKRRTPTLDDWDHIAERVEEVIAQLDADDPTPDLAGVTQDRGELDEALHDQLQTLQAAFVAGLDRARGEPDDQWGGVRAELEAGFDEQCEGIEEAVSLLHDVIEDVHTDRGHVYDGMIEELRWIKRDIVWMLRRQPR